jgi:curved DNA-binding protein CbpA
MRDLYAILGIRKDATQEEVKAAYRSKAMACHPDKGGSEEEFVEVGLAYRVLGDPDARARFDHTGETAKPDILSQAANLINNYLIRVIQERSEKVSSINVLQIIKETLHGEKNELRTNRRKAVREIRRIVEVKKRLTLKDDAQPFLLAALDERFGQVVVMLRAMRDGSLIIAKANELLNDYRYQQAVQPASKEDVMRFAVPSSFTFSFG